MFTETQEAQSKILLFLFWEETIYKGYIAVERIKNETDLSNPQIHNGLKTLKNLGFIDYIYRQKSTGIEEAKITAKGMEKAVKLLV